MAEQAQTPGRYEAVQTVDGDEQALGAVLLDGSGRMTLEQAADGDGTLAELVDRMNAKDVMFVEAPPPPDAPRFTLRSRVIRRGEPDFVPALKDYLRTNYKLELRPS